MSERAIRVEYSASIYADIIQNVMLRDSEGLKGMARPDAPGNVGGQSSGLDMVLSDGRRRQDPSVPLSNESRNTAKVRSLRRVNRGVAN